VGKGGTLGDAGGSSSWGDNNKPHPPGGTIEKRITKKKGPGKKKGLDWDSWGLKNRIDGIPAQETWGRGSKNHTGEKKTS